ncbi:MAG: transcriptional regulator [Chloroflexi bacterium]|nr:transcriptional regulator [Chloroflexota bacterium]
MSEPSLLVTKFTIPPLRTQLLPRAPLIKRLNQSSTLPLVLLSAGAGFGKTTLLVAWASQSTYPIAWLTLDSLDNDPVRFWSAVVTALRTCLPTIGEAAVAQLQAAQPAQPGQLLTALINDLAAAGEEIVLVLDDYHLIEEPSIHSSLLFLLDHAPSCLHLVLSSRTDPPLALSRLRARGQMAELRDPDLRVSEQEAASFLRQIMGLHLGAEDELLLAERTEGWLVGLQLAALSLSRRDDPSTWVSAFSGSQRLILDYLQDEVLARQPAAIRRFLLRVCILPRMNASLCEAVTRKAGSQQMLEALERSNLFVIALDEQRQWYRLHDLFREALLARLQVISPELLPAMYERAARWYERHGLLADAIEASLQSQSFEHAASLIERYFSPMNARLEYHTLSRWLAQLPQESIQARPALCFWAAYTIMFTTLRRSPASWARIEPLLLWAEQGFEAQDQWQRFGDALALHAVLAFFQGDVARGLSVIQRASLWLSEQSIMAGLKRLFEGAELLLAGSLDASWQSFLEAHRIYVSLGDIVATFASLVWLGEACLARGELHRAADYYQQALALTDENPEAVQHQLMTATGEREPFFVSWAYHNLAQLAYEWNDLSTAQQYIAQAFSFGQDPEEEIHLLTSGGLIRVRLLYRSGETREAQKLLETWERKARYPWDLRLIRVGQARIDLAERNLPAVERWSRFKEHFFGFPIHERDMTLPYVMQEEEALLLVRLLLAQEKGEEALQELVHWKEVAQTQGRMHTVLEILILESLAHFVARAIPQARSALRQALRQAQPENYQRLFLDEGQPMQVLLKGVLREVQEPELATYVRRLLNTFEQEQGPVSSSSASDSSGLLEPLTPQEQRVLHLLAEGASNQQIANQLVISLVTVKKHVTNLLSKLGATNRTQAIVLAREYGLL